jgi:hypothetical protein
VDVQAHTHILLMQYFERTGQFARAEDALHNILELQPGEPVLQQLGISFYHRVLAQNDAALLTGALPRAEVQAGLDELFARSS